MSLPPCSRRWFLRSAVLFSASAALALEPIPERPRITPDAPPPAATEIWTPVPAAVATPVGGVPSDAVVLFDGRSLAAWESVKQPGAPAPWKLEDDALVVEPNAGDIRTKQRFGDLQLHVEWRVPAHLAAKGKLSGNSGIFFMGLYELQILDSYQNPTYVNGLAGSIYKQHAPLVNASRAPGEWQSFDAIWEAPRFTADGKLERPAFLTVFQNGVLIHLRTPVNGPTAYRGKWPYTAHAAKLPLMLQEHKDPVAFRNLWVRELNL